MKILNFTAKEILPALLDRSKTQTIRKAWSGKSLVTIKEKPTTKEVKKLQKALNKCQKKDEILLPPDYKIKPLSKPPRFKVGEKVKLMWNQRSKNLWFCRYCGEDCMTWYPTGGEDCGGPYDRLYGCGCWVNCEHQLISESNYEHHHFPKTVGIVEMTEIFEIEMGQNDDNVWARPIKGRSFSFDDLAKRDGFKSAKEMFAWFDKTYNLNSPKKFYVYRWRIWSRNWGDYDNSI